MQTLDRDDRTDIVHVDYTAKVLGAINTLALESNFKSEILSIDDVDYSTYLNFKRM